MKIYTWNITWDFFSERKKSFDREKLRKFEAEGREF